MTKLSRFFWIFLAPNIVFLTVAWLTKNTQLIGIFNILNLALASMVTVAFSPVALDVVLSRRPIDHADWLGIGIFLGWSSTIVLRLYSIVWRLLGQPEWLTDSDILSYGLMLQMSAGILHLAAPGAINHRVPSRHWIKIGIIVGVCVLTALVLGYFFDALALEPLIIKHRP